MALVDIDPFDPAAALTGVEHRAVHQHVDRPVDVGVLHHIARILAAKLKPECGEGARRRALDGLPAGDGPGEVDEAEAARGDQRLRARVVEKQVLEHVLGNAACVERLGQTFARQKRLAGMFQHDAVPGDKRGNDGVDRRQEGIVPGRDDEDHALRRAFDPPVVAVRAFHDHRGQRLGGDAGHVVGAFVHPAEFAAIADRAAHLPGQFLDHLVGHGVQRGYTRADAGDAVV